MSEEAVYSCVRCGHNWSPHHKGQYYKYGTIPEQCPSCNSKNWDKPPFQRCINICNRFLNQLNKGVYGRRYLTSYDRRVVRKKTDYNIEYYWCKQCYIFMIPKLVLIHEKRMICPCCGGPVRTKFRKQHQKLRYKK